MKTIQFMLAIVMLAANLVFAADTDREKLLTKALQASALDVLASYQHSQMMLVYAELAQSGVTIETPQGKISKRKAKKLAKEHQRNVEVYEQVMHERGFQNLEGEYTFIIKGDCENAKAWWAVLGASEHCQDPAITQDGMKVTVTHQCDHEGETVELTQVGTTLDDAIIFIEELNSDFQYPGNIKNGVITLSVDAERALASWPSFEKPPSSKALKSCEITMTPKKIVSSNH